MAEFEEKLNQLLSSPQAMAQIMELANSIAGSPAVSKSTDEAASSTPEKPTAPMELLGGLDPSLLERIMILLNEYQGQQDEKTAFLTALRPFLPQERQHQLEQAIQITQMSRVIRKAIQLFAGGESEHV